MKVLLDENIDVRFKHRFPAEKHQVYTIRDMQWTGIKNGALLRLLADHQFDCWIVADKNIPYQQNTNQLPCLIIVLNVVRNTLKHIAPLVPQVLTELDCGNAARVVVVQQMETRD